MPRAAVRRKKKKHPGYHPREVKRAIKKCGNMRKLAEKMGCPYQYIQYFLKVGVPGPWAIPMELATDGEVPRFKTRPDLYPRPVPLQDSAISPGEMPQS